MLFQKKALTWIKIILQVFWTVVDLHYLYAKFRSKEG